MIKDKDKKTLEEQTYRPDDYKFIYKNLRDNVVDALQTSFPMEWGGFKLEVNNVHIPKSSKIEFNKERQQQALLKDEYLNIPVKGDLVLKDSNDQVVDSVKSKTLMHIPFYSERGTVIHNGNEYSPINQLRLRPGIYSRRRSNGELETQFNVQRGTGAGYRVSMAPETGVFKLEIGQSSSNLYSILHDVGVPDKEMIDAWGEDIFERNHSKYDSRALDKVHAKLVGKKSTATSREEKANELKTIFDNNLVDKDIKDINLL